MEPETLLHRLGEYFSIAPDGQVCWMRNEAFPELDEVTAKAFEKYVKTDWREPNGRPSSATTR